MILPKLKKWDIKGSFAMTKGIFITGNGTDVGKTYVTAITAKRLVKKGINAGK